MVWNLNFILWAPVLMKEQRELIALKVERHQYTVFLLLLSSETAPIGEPVTTAIGVSVTPAREAVESISVEGRGLGARSTGAEGT